MISVTPQHRIKSAVEPESTLDTEGKSENEIQDIPEEAPHPAIVPHPKCMVHVPIYNETPATL
jgi:hypothetical protein